MFKIFAVILVLFTNVLAQLCLRKGMMGIDINGISFQKILEIISSIYIWIGLFFYVMSFTMYLYILSKFEVSYIYPIIMGSGFVLLLIFSVLFLNETITFKRVIGIMIISVGIFVINLK